MWLIADGVHPPGYNYLGPTRHNDYSRPPKNIFDAYAYLHDIHYAQLERRGVKTYREFNMADDHFVKSMGYIVQHQSDRDRNRWIKRANEKFATWWYRKTGKDWHPDPLTPDDMTYAWASWNFFRVKQALMPANMNWDEYMEATFIIPPPENAIVPEDYFINGKRVNPSMGGLPDNKKQKGDPGDPTEEVKGDVPDGSEAPTDAPTDAPMTNIKKRRRNNDGIWYKFIDGRLALDSPNISRNWWMWDGGLVWVK